MGDLRVALRQLGKAPGFTLAAVLTLALGIGANTAMFSVVDALLLRSLPYDEAERLVQVWEASEPGQRNSVSSGVFSDWARHTTAFEGLAAVAVADFNLKAAGEPERVRGVRASAALLRLLRARPIAGRIFAADEDQPGREPVVVLGHRLWQRRFGGDPAVVGRPVRLDGSVHTVIGVLPRGFLPWDEVELVVPLVIAGDRLEVRGSHGLQAIGRLAPGADLIRAAADLRAAAAPYRDRYPTWKRHWMTTMLPLHEALTGDVRPILLVLQGAVALVLLIACANVANLLLARATARRKEFAVRMAVGASRGRVVRQWLGESLLLALLGAALGLGLAFAATAAIRSASGALPRAEHIAVDERVLGFALVASLLTGLTFGLVPALHAMRNQPAEVLKEGGRGPGGGHDRTRNALIVAEVALALVLLAGAGLLVRSFARLLDVAPGFEPRGALALQLSLPESAHGDIAARAAFTDRVLAAIRALPGVEGAGAATTLPLVGAFDLLFKIPGRHGPADGFYSADYDFASPDFFRALGVPLLRGRVFDERDAGSNVALVNETFARTHFPTGDVLGQELEIRDQRWQIVGVVGDLRQRSLQRRIAPFVYRPLAATGSSGRAIVVRTAADPETLAEPIRRAVLALDPDLPIAHVRSLEAVVAASLGQRRLVLVVLGLFAGCSFLLAAVGLYGVVAFSVSQRTREIGIRIAIGATRGDVLGHFVALGLRLAALGVALGLIAGLGFARLLSSQLFDVGSADPVTFAGASALLLAVAALAALLPARRAARVDPIHALR